MRNDFARQMIEEMDRDESIVFLTGDLGYNALEKLEKAFPKRFINVGISEQHMMGMAAGLALEGKKAIAYSIASFATMRAYEFIRDDICYQNLDVKIIGVGGGYNYGTAGVTHHTIEDLAIMRVLPHMQVIAPCYSWEAIEATKALMRSKGPAYLRIGKSPGIAYEKPDFKFEIGKAYVVREGNDVALISTGNVLDTCMQTADFLEKNGFSAAVISMPSVKPIDRTLLKQFAQRMPLVTIEEHSVVGGLASAVEAALRNERFRLEAIGMPADRFLTEVGDRNHMLKIAGITPEKIAERLKSIL